MDAVRTVLSNEKDTFLLSLHSYVPFAFECLLSLLSHTSVVSSGDTFSSPALADILWLCLPQDHPHAAKHPWQTYKVPLLRTCSLSSNNFAILDSPKQAFEQYMIFCCRTQNIADEVLMSLLSFPKTIQLSCM